MSGSDDPVVVMAPLPQPNWGGLHAVIEAVAPLVRKSGFEIRPVTPVSAPAIHERFHSVGLRAETLAQSRLRRSLSPVEHARFLAGLVKDPRALADLARRLNARIIQAAGLQCVQGPLAARRSGLSLVWQIHSDFLPPAARRVLTPMATRMSDVIMVNGSGVRAAFPLIERLPEERIVEFRAPIDADRFTFTKADREAARARLGVDASTVLVGTIGARAYQKAHERIVAMASALDGDERVRTVILGGEIAAQAEAYQRDVREPAERAALTARNKLTWIDAGAHICDYLPALDIFVMPSRAEGIPVAMLEAMAAGLPVVASEVGSIGAVIEPDESGFLIKPDPFDANGFVTAGAPAG